MSGDKWESSDIQYRGVVHDRAFTAANYSIRVQLLVPESKIFLRSSIARKTRD